jgi:hypothetical protein
MKRIWTILFIITLFSGCKYENSGITEDMKINMISFKQEDVDFENLKNNELREQKKLQGRLIKEANNNILSIKYTTEETGCPKFEGGFLINNDTLILYYQDVNYRLVKCIDYFELNYEIDISNVKFDEIKVTRLEPINEGFHFVF